MYCESTTIPQLLPSQINQEKFDIYSQTEFQKETGISTLQITITQDRILQLQKDDIMAIEVILPINYELSLQKRSLALVVTQYPYTDQNTLAVQLKQNMNDYPSLNYVDFTAYKAKKQQHYIDLNIINFINSLGQNSQDFTFYIQFIDTNYVFQADTQYKVIYSVKIMKYKTMDCPFNCNERQGRCEDQGECFCQNGYFDIDCSLQAYQIVNQQKIHVEVQPKMAKYYYYIVSEVEGDLNIRFGERQPTQMGWSFIYHKQNYNRPFYTGGSYIQANSEVPIFYDKIRNYQIYGQRVGLESQQQVIIFGFYNEYDTNQGFYLTIFEEDSQKDKKDEFINNLYIYLISILVLILLILIILIIYCKKRSNTQVNTEQHAIQIQQLEEQRRLEKQMKKAKFLKKYKALIERLMPKHRYSSFVKKYPLLEQQSECIVCLVGFESEEETRFTLCGHMFHIDCFEQWVVKNFNCPFCREDFGPRALMKIYRSKKEGTYEQLNDNEKKQSDFVKRIKGLLPIESTEFDILDQPSQSQRRGDGTQPGTEFQEQVEDEDENGQAILMQMQDENTGRQGDNQDQINEEQSQLYSNQNLERQNSRTQLRAGNSQFSINNRVRTDQIATNNNELQLSQPAEQTDQIQLRTRDPSQLTLNHLNSNQVIESPTKQQEGKTLDSDQLNENKDNKLIRFTDENQAEQVPNNVNNNGKNININIQASSVYEQEEEQKQNNLYDTGLPTLQNNKHSSKFSLQSSQMQTEDNIKNDALSLQVQRDVKSKYNITNTSQIFDSKLDSQINSKDVTMINHQNPYRNPEYNDISELNSKNAMISQQMSPRGNTNENMSQRLKQALNQIPETDSMANNPSHHNFNSHNVYNNHQMTNMSDSASKLNGQTNQYNSKSQFVSGNQSMKESLANQQSLNNNQNGNNQNKVLQNIGLLSLQHNNQNNNSVQDTTPRSHNNNNNNINIEYPNITTNNNNQQENIQVLFENQNFRHEQQVQQNQQHQEQSKQNINQQELLSQ